MLVDSSPKRPVPTYQAEARQDARSSYLLTTLENV